MPLNPVQIREIEAALAEINGAAPSLADLRRRLPFITIGLCDASDMDFETPYRGYLSFDLYLIDRRDHCARLTRDPDCATGIMIARHGAGG